MVDKVINSSIDAQLQVLQTISLNLANVSTPGYIRQSSFVQHLNGSIVASNKVSTGHLDSAIRQTDNHLDFAVLGKSLFVVELQGQTYVTQDGRFHVDSEGRLRHVSGAYAVSAGGYIDAAADNLAQQLKMVSTTYSNVALTPMSAGLYNADWSQWHVDDNVRVVSGALNHVQHDSTADTIGMLQVQRSIESLQKTYQAYDAVVSYGITELGGR